jgi:hypothetical protein
MEVSHRILGSVGVVPASHASHADHCADDAQILVALQQKLI